MGAVNTELCLGRTISGLERRRHANPARHADRNVDDESVQLVQAEDARKLADLANADSGPFGLKHHKPDSTEPVRAGRSSSQYLALSACRWVLPPHMVVPRLTRLISSAFIRRTAQVPQDFPAPSRHRRCRGGRSSRESWRRFHSRTAVHRRCNDSWLHQDVGGLREG